ncbi:hypothetical protein K2X30_11565 [bacterium]|nr:hypothetical protein [bacterium]
MKKTTILWALMAGTQAWAAAPTPDQIRTAVEALNSCDSFIRYDDEYAYTGFKNGRIILRSVADPTQVRGFSLRAAPVDVIRRGDQLYVLTTSNIEQWDLTTSRQVGMYPTFTWGHGGPASQPTGMVFYKNKLVISHGRLGVTVFDLVSKKVVRQAELVSAQLPLESMAMAITSQGSKAYIALDSYTLVRGGTSPFKGVVLFNMDTLQVEAELTGLDPGVNMVLSDSKNLIVGYWGLPIWKYDLSKVRALSMPNPEKRVWSWPEDGFLKGTPTIDAKYYYSCFQPVVGGKTQPSAARAWQRTVLDLD